MAKRHELKIWTEYYLEHARGVRPFEIRKNDRNYQVGDEVELRAFDMKSNRFTDDPPIVYTVTTISTFQQRLDYVVLGLQPFQPRAGIDTAESAHLREIDCLLARRTATDGLDRLEAIRLMMAVCQRTDANGAIAKGIREGETLRGITPPAVVQAIADAGGGKVDECFALPDGSGGAVVSFPLPADHWLTKPGFNVPPMPFRLGTDHPRHRESVKAIWEAGKYAIRASTMKGREMDFDPDAMCQNFVIGLLGYNTPDGLTYGSIYLHEDQTALDPTGQLIPPPPVNAPPLREMDQAERTAAVLELIETERRRQVEEKGYTNEHDDQHTVDDFYGFMGGRLEEGVPQTKLRKNLIEIAALAVAALEKLDRERQ